MTTEIDSKIIDLVQEQYKVIYKGLKDNKVLLDFIEPFDSKDEKLSEIEFLFDNRNVILNNQITEDEYFKLLESKNITDVETTLVKEEPYKKVIPPKTQEIFPEKIKIDDFLDTLSENVLEKALQRKNLSKPLSGKLIYKDGKVNFELNEIKWPEGEYNIKVEIIKG